MDDTPATPMSLSKGQNVGLSTLGAELGGLTVFLDSRGRGDDPIEADVSVLLLRDDGRVRSDADLVFYNQPIGPGGAVRLRDRVRPTRGSDEADAGWTSDVITLELDDVPDEVSRIVLSASLDPSIDKSFGDVDALRMRVQRTSDAVDLLVFDIHDSSTELALLFGEFYRRQGEWKVRAVGQGYADGLGALVADHGVEVADDGEETQDQDGTTEAGPSADTPSDPVGDDETSTSSPIEVITGGVSVRRPTRAPRLPKSWDKSIPAQDGDDWQVARLFPVAGIGTGEEQERRATSALLAVMSLVRDFGAALVARCGGPRGTISTFVEVPFGKDKEAYRPDGVIQVKRGQRTWTAIVEVKTSSGRLGVDQIERYVEIARAKGYDAVVTISNELIGGDADHPVAVDRRKLRKVALHHLSWDQIRADATVMVGHRGIQDVTQHRVLDEFLRYMAHPRSGMGGLGDMGPNWVKVRETVKAKTARSSDGAVGEVSARFDELIQHLAHHFTGLLGVEVRALAPREAPDHASRRQQLADSGLLFGRLKVPGAVDVIVITADLRADKVSATISVPAPRGEMRPQTRINWLLRQLPDELGAEMRVEARLAGPRSTSTAALLSAVREDPSLLLPSEQREIRAFTISRDVSLGPKRASGPGTLIHSVRTVSTAFYADVVQHLRPWANKR